MDYNSFVGETPPNYQPEQSQQVPNYYNAPYMSQEQEITNIVGQIDPKTIIDNLDHALKGEHFDKERGEWIMNASGKGLVNDSCRGAIISYLDGILTNNTTMANIDEKRLSFLMESVIETVTKMFVVNLEEFGFVKECTKKKLVTINEDNFLLTEYEIEETKKRHPELRVWENTIVLNGYENKGTPDTARMTLVSNMIYKVCFLVFTRALRGQESIRIFKSLNMNDAMMYGGMQQQQKSGWVGKLFGR